MKPKHSFEGSQVSSGQIADRTWLLRRRHEERAQAETVRWFIINCRSLGVTDYRLLIALAAWLGIVKKSAFFVLRHLSSMGYCPEGPRLMLAVPRASSPGYLIWFTHPEARETAAVREMKDVLASQGYQVGTFISSQQACLAIADYLSGSNSGPL